MVEDLEVSNPWASVKRLIAERESLEICCPRSGDQIVHSKTGRTGEVFWVSKENPHRRRRIGFIPDDPQPGDQNSTHGRTAGKKIVWAFAAEVEVATGWNKLEGGLK